MTETRIVHTTGRNNCGGRCIIHARVRDGEIVGLSTDTPAQAGESIPLCACARGMNYAKTFLSPERLRWPMKRVGQRGEGKFVRITWQEAVDTIAREWIRIRDTYGPGSRYVTYATGVSAAFSPRSLAQRLLALDGGYLDFYNSYSTACIEQATRLMYGTAETGSSPETLLDSKLILLWGHNPAETRFDCTTMHYLTRAKEKGIPIVVIDPRESDTVRALGAEWIPIRPATDAALQDAMAWVIWSEGLHDQAFLDRCCLGFDAGSLPDGVPETESVLAYLTGRTDGIAKTPEWAENICGVPADTIRTLARRYAAAKPAVLLMGYGAQRHAYGEQGVRGGILLACMTGNVGIRGGWASGHALYERHHSFPSVKLPNPYGRAIPTFCWTEAVDRGHTMGELDGVRGGALDSDIKMILNLAGNCLINQHSDINRTAALLQDTSKCEFIVCSDLFLTSSAKFADILLPGVSFLESENLTEPWKWGDFIGYNNQVVEPVGEGRFEYDWLCEVADRLGLREKFTLGRDTRGWLEHLYNELRVREPELPEFETFRQAGIYRYRNNPTQIAFEAQCHDPERTPFPTESGRIELFSPALYEGRIRCKDFFPAIPRYVAPPEGPQDPLRQRYPLQLIGWHTKRRCHSIHDNNPALEKLDPQRLWLHPADAAERGISDGDLVEVWNDRGKTRAPALVTERICPGVAALAQGSWYRPDGDGVDTNGSINVLTHQHPTPYARGNPQHTNLVQVRRFACGDTMQASGEETSV